MLEESSTVSYGESSVGVVCDGAYFSLIPEKPRGHRPRLQTLLGQAAYSNERSTSCPASRSLRARRLSNVGHLRKALPNTTIEPGAIVCCSICQRFEHGCTSS